MKHLSSILSLLLLAFAALGSHAAIKVNLHTTDTSAVSVVLSQGYNFTPLSWDASGNATVSLEEGASLNINQVYGYVINSVSICGTQVCGMTSLYTILYADLAALQEEGKFTDAATVEINASTRPESYVVINGDNEMFDVSYQYHVFSESEWGVGSLRFKITDSSLPIEIRSKADYALKAVVKNGNNELSVPGATSFSIYPSTLSAGDNIFDVEAYSLDDARTSSFTLDVEGNRNLVKVRRAGSAESIPTSELSAPIRFNPDTEVPIFISHQTYQQHLYSVQLNGEEAEEVDGEFRLDNIKSGDVVKVVVDYPDVDVQVKFNFANPATDGAVLMVSNTTFNAYDRKLWTSDDFTVKLGSTVRVTLDKNNYNIESATLNGEGNYDENITFLASDPNGYVIDVTAQPKEPYNVTIYYEGYPAHFRVLLGDDDNADNYIEMTGDDTMEIAVARNINRIRFIPDADWLITAVYADGEESSADTYVTGNMAFDVYVEQFARPLQASVYCDPSAAWAYRSVTLSKGVEGREKIIYPADGYTLINYSDEDLPIYFEAQCAEGAPYVAYLNGDETALGEVTDLPDGSVVKYYAAAPQQYKVSFEIDDNVEASIMTDLITDHATPADLTLMAGTRVDIRPADSELSEVLVDGTPLVADAAGNYAFEVKDAHTVAVRQATPSGVENFGQDDRQQYDVFSLQGIRVRKGLTAKEVRSLPAGIYIVAGKKLIVK